MCAHVYALMCTAVRTDVYTDAYTDACTDAYWWIWMSVMSKLWITRTNIKRRALMRTDVCSCVHWCVLLNVLLCIMMRALMRVLMCTDEYEWASRTDMHLYDKCIYIYIYIYIYICVNSAVNNAYRYALISIRKHVSSVKSTFSKYCTKYKV